MRQQAWLDINPHPSLWQQEKLKVALQEMSRKRPIKLVNEDGFSINIKSIISENWKQHDEVYKKRKEASKAMNEKKHGSRKAQTLSKN